MSPIKMSENILQTAITKEEMTRSFYLKVSEKVSNPTVKEPLQQMAQEEQKHKDMLLARLKDEYGSEFVPQDFSGDEKYRVAEQEITTHEHALVVIRSAMELEDEAIKFYTSQLDKVDHPEDQELLGELIDFEEGHRSWLEKEYKNMSTSSHWLP